MSSRDGSSALLPVDPSEEELARHWTLSPEDRLQVEACRGDGSRLSFALQLCALRRQGAFLEDLTRVPLRIVNHLGRQLGLPPVLFLELPRRRAPIAEHQARLREYLGLRSYGPEVEGHLRQWLEAQASQAKSPDELRAGTEAQLLAWKVILPGSSTLARVVGAVSRRSQEEVFGTIAESLSAGKDEALEGLLAVRPGEPRSPLSLLKEDPPEATVTAILTYLDRFDELRRLGAGELAWPQVPGQWIENLARLAQRYTARALRRFPEAKRLALVACFVAEAHKSVLDHLVALHDQFVTGLARRARNAFERRYRQERRLRRRSLATVLDALESLLDTDIAPDGRVGELLARYEIGTLRAAVAACRRFQHLEDQGHLDELRNRHAHLKRYLPGFLALPFRVEPGSERLLEARDLALQLHRGELPDLPRHAPVGFVPAGWRSALRRKDGRPDRRLWEIALAFAFRDALRAGDLYLPESRHHVSFWNLVYDERRWEEERPRAYAELGLPSEADRALEALREELGGAAASLLQDLADNPFATLEEGRLRLRRPDALELPPPVRELRRVMETHLPRVRLEALLVDVDRGCGFTRAFQPLPGYRPRSGDRLATLLAALVAHGTNLGLATMGQSAEGISVDMLQHASQWLLRTDTLKAANTALVDYHYQLPLAAAWGDGTLSSSDGQRFGLQASSVLGSFYPRYFGYYERALTVYTHLSDQYSVFASRAISCAPREALYVLDGLLENDSILRPEEHTTDTHGATEQLFGLCFLLGLGFMPRLRDLADQQLYRPAAGVSYGALDPLFRGSVDSGLIQEQWDPLVRLAASLRHRTAPAHVVLQRLAASSRSDRLAKALTALGRLVKTVYILRYLQDEDLRRRVQLQLNRGEARHQLARRLFFANQGAFRTADYEEIMNKVSALSLLSNAVLVWNTVRMSDILARLRGRGQDLVPEDLARLSPLAHAHVIPNGTYRFQQAIARDEAEDRLR